MTREIGLHAEEFEHGEVLRTLDLRIERFKGSEATGEEPVRGPPRFSNLKAFGD